MPHHTETPYMECPGEKEWPIGKKSAFYTLAITFLLGMFDFVDRQVMAALFPYLKAEYALSDTQLGMLVAIVNISIAVLVIPSAYFVDKWSRTKMIGIMAGVWSLATGACAFAGSYGQLFVARAFIGAGEAGYNPAAQSLIAASFPKRLRGTAISIVQCGFAIGSPVGLMAGAYIATHWGWRHAFGIVAIPGLFLAVLALFIKDFKNTPPSVKEKETQVSYFKTILTLLRTPSLLFVYFAAAFALILGGAMMNWLPTYFVREGGMSNIQASGITSLWILSSAVATLFAGPLIDWVRTKRADAASLWQIFTLIASGVTLFCALRFVAVGSTLQIVLLMFQNLLISGMVVIGFLLISDLSKSRYRGTAISLLITMQNIFGFAVGPLLTGILSDHFNIGVSLQIMSLCYVVAGLCYVVVHVFYLRDVARLGCDDVQF